MLIPSSKDEPIVLEIPLRELFIIGHRGAPHHFPENTIASFKKALDLGANGLEKEKRRWECQKAVFRLTLC
ncbi:MAG: hypothetical protein HY088_05560 [Ignavibacteriales bacterium]|nr:hypothetical protein [Ignavibacteriales bacterium]